MNFTKHSYLQSVFWKNIKSFIKKETHLQCYYSNAIGSCFSICKTYYFWQKLNTWNWLNKALYIFSHIILEKGDLIFVDKSKKIPNKYNKKYYFY